MLGLLLPLLGFAFLDSLNVLNLGVTSAVVYDSRLSRRSALPGGLSFVGGRVRRDRRRSACSPCSA